MYIIGHRGARAEAPENSIAGFKYTQGLGIEHIEFDVRLNANDELVVIHDHKLDRTSTSQGLVKDFTTTQLQQVQLHEVAGIRCGQGVPTLAQLFKNTSFKSCQLELKADHVADRSLLAQSVVNFIALNPSAISITVTSKSVSLLEQVKLLNPNQAIGLVVGNAFMDMLKVAKKIDCQLLIPRYPLATSTVIRQAHGMGMQVSVWTVNDAADMKRMMDLGVDSVISDRPSLALEVFG